MIRSTEPDVREHWYVAQVRSCQERKAAEALRLMGYEYYLPSRREIHQWSDRRKAVDTLLIPCIIFIRCTEPERMRPMQAIPALLRYMSNGDGAHHPAVVPDAEMELFQAMVEKSGRAVTLSSSPLAPGDRVRILSGPLCGCICELTGVAGKRYVTARLASLGTVMMDLETDILEKV